MLLQGDPCNYVFHRIVTTEQRLMGMVNSVGNEEMLL